MGRRPRRSRPNLPLRRLRSRQDSSANLRRAQRTRPVPRQSRPYLQETQGRHPRNLRYLQTSRPRPLQLLPRCPPRQERCDLAKLLRASHTFRHLNLQTETLTASRKEYHHRKIPSLPRAGRQSRPLCRNHLPQTQLHLCLTRSCPFLSPTHPTRRHQRASASRRTDMRRCQHLRQHNRRGAHRVVRRRPNDKVS